MAARFGGDITSVKEESFSPERVGRLLHSKPKLNMSGHAQGKSNGVIFPSTHVSFQDQEMVEDYDKVRGKNYQNWMKTAESYFLALTEGQTNIPVLPIKNSSDSLYEIPVHQTYKATPHFLKNGELRDYQIRGLNWMISLYKKGIEGGILADEMGLGKTIQTIALLGYLYHVKKVKKPSLIVVPLSTLNNWFNELYKWCPTLRAIKFYVNTKIEHDDLRKAYRSEHYDVVLTTYEFIKGEVHFFQRSKFEFMIVDEGHRVKNDQSKNSQVLMSLHAEYRLILTGTPIQNNIGELWALLRFLFPKMYQSKKDFEYYFNMKTCLETPMVSRRLQMLLRPIMFRRTKQAVEKNIPPKCEMIVYVDFTPQQKAQYQQLFITNSVQLYNQSTPSFVLKGFCMHLRKSANHPFMFRDVEPPRTPMEVLVAVSGKLAFLDKLLDRLKAKGHRVLIFSQFITMLDILEDYFDWKGFNYLRLDGSVQTDIRQERIDKFNQNNEFFIFMLSTRAGGLGINLNTADTVIFYDSDFNPHADSQAMDRAHRIGQTKPVRVFRLITHHSCEERILEVSQRKKLLDQVVVSGKNLSNFKMDSRTLWYIIRKDLEQVFGKTEIPECIEKIKAEPLDLMEIDNEKLESYFLPSYFVSRSVNPVKSEEIFSGVSKVREDIVPASTEVEKVKTRASKSFIEKNQPSLGTFQIDFPPMVKLEDVSDDINHVDKLLEQMEAMIKGKLAETEIVDDAEISKKRFRTG